MRRLVAVLIIALMAGPAFAQIGGMNLLDIGNNRKKSQEDIDREQAADEAYKSAIKKVPDQKKATNDPWADVRGTSQPPATVQKPPRSSASNKPN